MEADEVEANTLVHVKNTDDTKCVSTGRPCQLVQHNFSKDRNVFLYQNNNDNNNNNNTPPSTRHTGQRNRADDLFLREVGYLSICYLPPIL